MGKTLTTSMYFHLSAMLRDAAVGDLGVPKHDAVLSKTLTLGDGVGNNQADIVHAVQYTIAGSGSQVIDLNAITDTLGNAITFAKVKLMAFYAAIANGGEITVKPNTALNPFNLWITDDLGSIPIEAGNLFMVSNIVGGWAVGDNSSDKILLTNTDAAASVIDVMIIGTDT